MDLLLTIDVTTVLWGADYSQWMRCTYNWPRFEPEGVIHISYCLRLRDY